MDLSFLQPPTNVQDRRPQFDDPSAASAALSQPSFRYANPFRDAPWPLPQQAPGELAQAAGAGDFQQLTQMLRAQSALQQLQARGQLPSHAWYNNAPLPSVPQQR